MSGYRGGQAFGLSHPTHRFGNISSKEQRRSKLHTAGISHLVGKGVAVENKQFNHAKMERVTVLS